MSDRPTDDVLDSILNRTHPPVGQLRVMSQGMSLANTVSDRTAVAGTRACIACGNCVDACPVLRDRGTQLSSMRTSMALETLVGTDCRRCFKCVAACPQVEPELKNVARSHRRPERVAHYLLAIGFVILSVTGLLMYYFTDGTASTFAQSLLAIHWAGALAFLAGFAVYLLAGRRAAARTARRLVRWNRADRDWCVDLFRGIVTIGRRGRFMRGDLNPAQRVWYLTVVLIVVWLGATGITLTIGVSASGMGRGVACFALHVLGARIADIAVLVHIGLKAGWPVIRDARNVLRPQLGAMNAGSWPPERRGR